MLKDGLRITSNSSEETFLFGTQLAPLLPQVGGVAFKGLLGAGKTLLIKGIISTLTNTPHTAVNSPTFQYLNTYAHIAHFDCYRLNEHSFITQGFDTYFETALCLIEWPEHITTILPKTFSTVTITYTGDNTRSIDYEPSSI